MVVVTEVKTLTCRDTKILLRKNLYLPSVKHKEDVCINCMDLNLETEYIVGKRYIYPKRGIDIVIALKPDVAELFGLQYEAFEDLEKNVQDLRLDNNNLKLRLSSLRVKLHKKIDELISIHDAGFWTRLKYLFTSKFKRIYIPSKEERE